MTTEPDTHAADEAAGTPGDDGPHTRYDPHGASAVLRAAAAVLDGNDGHGDTPATAFWRILTAAHYLLSAVYLDDDGRADGFAAAAHAVPFDDLDLRMPFNGADAASLLFTLSDYYAARTQTALRVRNGAVIGTAPMDTPTAVERHLRVQGTAATSRALRAVGGLLLNCTTDQPDQLAAVRDLQDLSGNLNEWLNMLPVILTAAQNSPRRYRFGARPTLAAGAAEHARRAGTAHAPDPDSPDDGADTPTTGQE